MRNKAAGREKQIERHFEESRSPMEAHNLGPCDNLALSFITESMGSYVGCGLNWITHHHTRG